MTESESNSVDDTKKKRTAERQITKDDAPDQDDDEGGDGGSFRKADEKVLAQRRIVRAKRPTRPVESTAASSTASKSTNPFANVTLTGNATDPSSKPIVFGAGTGLQGFASVKKDDKESSTSTATGFGSTTGFGSGFGASSSTGAGGSGTFGSGTGFAGFGTKTESKGFGFGAAAADSKDGKPTTKNLFDVSNVKSHGFGFGAIKKSETDETEKTDADKKIDVTEDPTKKADTTNTTTTTEFPKDVDLKTGEEGETILFEIRAAVHKWEKIEKTPSSPTGASPAAPAVPPSSSSIITTTKPKEDGPDAAAGSPTKGEKCDANFEWGWKSCGAGQLKVLQASKGKVRVVHRTQGKNHDDKPIAVRVNDRLWKESKVIMTGDKTKIKVIFPVAGEDGATTRQYLFKTKEEEDAKKLSDLLNEKIEEAISCFEPATTEEAAAKST